MRKFLEKLELDPNLFDLPKKPSALEEKSSDAQGFKPSEDLVDQFIVDSNLGRSELKRLEEIDTDSDIQMLDEGRPYYIDLPSETHFRGKFSPISGEKEGKLFSDNRMDNIFSGNDMMSFNNVRSPICNNNNWEMLVNSKQSSKGNNMDSLLKESIGKKNLQELFKGEEDSSVTVSRFLQNDETSKNVKNHILKSLRPEIKSLMDDLNDLRGIQAKDKFKTTKEDKGLAKTVETLKKFLKIPEICKEYKVTTY